MGYGYPTSFFLRKQIHGVDTLVENPWFGLSYFPPALARSPSPISIPAKKPPGTFRIFLFGESAAMGDPRPAYGVGRYLETLLDQRYPGTKFEVVCVAMTAINSHALVRIARECAGHQGDLWIVYMGNNEFAGPFGAITVFGAQAPPVWAVRAYLAVESTRVGQLLVRLSRSLRLGPVTPASWGGLKMFMAQQLPPRDPRRERVYRNFQRNLADLVGNATRAGVPLILSSVAVNLKDCPPFESSEATNAASQSLCRAAQEESTRGSYPEAVRDFTKALERNPDSAATHFRLAECYLAQTNFAAARLHFSRARDLDILPLRADDSLNNAVANAAKQSSGKGAVYVDAEAALGPLSESHIAGAESFLEHVHLNWDGNYRLAVAFAERARKCLPNAVTRTETAAWADPAACAAELGLTDWNRCTILEEILRRLSEPPFTAQLNHEARLKELTDTLRGLRSRMVAPAAAAARDLYERALRRHSHDHWLHHNYAEFLAQVGDLPGATEQMRAVCELLPDSYTGYFQLGRLLGRQKKYDEARRSLETALRLRPDVFDARVELGQILAAQDKPEEALSQYALARRAYGEDNARVCFLEAEVFGSQKKRAETIAKLREAIRLKPDYWEAHESLGIDLALAGEYQPAQAEFEEVLRVRPAYAEGHLNLGLALARQQHFAEALEQFETTLRLDPRNERARGFVATIHQMQAGRGSP